MVISDPRRKTRDQVRELRRQGFEVRDIAKLLDITTQRVYQHLAKIREEEEGRAS